MILQGLHAVITGGSRGIGFAIAQRFCAEGARVTIAARSAGEVDAAAAALRAIAPDAAGGVLDVGDARAVRAFFAALPPVHLLVACAGVQGAIGPLAGSDDEDWERAVRVNLLGTRHCMAAALPGMIERRAGKIITLSGGGSTGPRALFSAYAASKTAVLRLTETAAVELRPYGIDVNAIAPGAVNTRMTREVADAGERAGAERAEALQRLADGGTPPEKAADLALFLASPASDGITGKLLSAVWDPYDDPAFQERLRSDADFATLRRIDGKHFASR
jgi:NAD(P)-dependent dehydrogenase (short-subunit alcohol dehydrogenase family)